MLEKIILIESSCDDSIAILKNIVQNLSTQNINYILKMQKTFQLKLEEKTLSIIFNQNNFKPFILDYNSSKYLDCIKNAKKSLLNKACKLKPQNKILDMSCGWGKDSLTMACLGANITSIEVNPLVAILVQYAKAKLYYNWKLIIEDSVNYIKNNKDFDIVYLDPMFPPKKNLSNKNLQILSLLCKPTSSIEYMLEHVLKTTKSKTVIKLPLKYSIRHKPNYKIYGKTIKWYIFIPS